MRISSSANSSLECEMRVFSLDEKPVYKALSYRCTEAPPTQKIWLNDRSFYLRPNLYNFFCQISGEETHWMFIDAICIDQDNLDERSQQVRLMRDVYMGAIQVIAWLGDALVDTDWHFSAENVFTLYWPDFKRTCGLKSFATWYEAEFPSFFEYYGNKLLAAEAETEAAPEQKSNINEEKALIFITPFLLSDYWKRTWIIQEIVLARSLMIRWKNLVLSGEMIFSLLRLALGTDVVDQFLSFPAGDVMTSMLELGYDKRSDPRHYMPNGLAACQILSMRNRLHSTICQPVRAIPLHEVLATFFWHDCHLPYDKIFGLLGVTSSVLRADYRMPKLELFTRVVFETMLQFATKSMLESPQRSDWMTISSLHRVALSATVLDLDHPTVTITLQGMFRCLEMDGYLRRMLPYLLLQSPKFRSACASEAHAITLDQAEVRATRLWRFCSRYKKDTILLPVDETGPETLATRLRAVMSIFMDVIPRMILLHGAIPKGLPVDPLLHSHLSEIPLLSHRLAHIDRVLSPYEPWRQQMQSLFPQSTSSPTEQ